MFFFTRILVGFMPKLRTHRVINIIISTMNPRPEKTKYEMFKGCPIYAFILLETKIIER